MIFLINFLISILLSCIFMLVFFRIFDPGLYKFITSGFKKEYSYKWEEIQNLKETNRQLTQICINPEIKEEMEQIIKNG